MKPFQFRIRAFFLMLIMICALTPLAMAQDNSADVSLEVPEPGSHKTLSLPRIDIATDSAGVSFKYNILIELTQDQFDQYIAPLSENEKWKKDQAQNFTITFPATLFDQELLTVDWSKVQVDNRFLMQLKSPSSTDIIIEGMQNSTYVNKTYADFCLYAIVPVKLEEEKLQAALEKGSIDLKGNVTVTGGVDGTSPLTFTVDHSIPVIDSNNPKLSLNVTGSNESTPPPV